MLIEGIGIDITEIGRFRSLIKQKKLHLLDKMFSKAEREYCFSYADAATHLAGTFAAKESVIKSQENAPMPITSIEIRRQKSGKPEVWIRGRRSKSFLISITHSRDIAVAIALKNKV